jgi:hypothetical protein
MLTVFTLCGLDDSSSCEVETAVKGRVITKGELYHRIDFSEYAKKQKYLGDWDAPKLIRAELCVEEK